MKSTMVIKIPNQRIVGVRLLEDGSCELVLESMEKSVVKIVGLWAFIEASKLSLNDRFMKHRPRTEAEKKLKAELTEAIRQGVKDFWRPRCDPSFDKECTLHWEMNRR